MSWVITASPIRFDPNKISMSPIDADVGDTIFMPQYAWKPGDGIRYEGGDWKNPTVKYLCGDHVSFKLIEKNVDGDPYRVVLKYVMGSGFESNISLDGVDYKVEKAT
jgi:hypothetical protein